MSLFGSSGIRGKVGEDFTVELAIKIGSAIGSLNKDVVLAKDSPYKRRHDGPSDHKRHHLMRREHPLCRYGINANFSQGDLGF